MGGGQPESNPFVKNALSIAQNCSQTQISFPNLNVLAKNVVSIAKNCSETQMLFARAQPSRQKRGVDRPKL